MDFKPFHQEYMVVVILIIEPTKEASKLERAM